MSRPAVVTRDLSIVYGSGKGAVVALDGFNATVDENEFVAIIGPSGCGKSSLLKAICDLLPAEVVQGVVEVHGKSPYDARRDNAFAFAGMGRRGDAGVCVPRLVVRPRR